MNVDAALTPEHEEAISLALEQSDALMDEDFRQELELSIGQLAIEDQSGAPLPPIAPEAEELIVRFETGGEWYYNKKLKRPSWPGYSSGITIGFGFDLGYNTAEHFQLMWGGLLDDTYLNTLSQGIGLKAPGNLTQIHGLLPQMQHIEIPWEMGQDVFRADSIPRYRGILHRRLEASASLPGKCEGALLSIVFNRGASFDRSGDRYQEMREIKRLVTADQLDGVPAQIRSMRRPLAQQSSTLRGYRLGAIRKQRFSNKAWRNTQSSFQCQLRSLSPRLIRFPLQ